MTTKNPILRSIAHLLIPAILLYALYVQFHGEYSAGGGFQAGIIFTAGLVLYTLIYGVERVAAVVSQRCAEIIAATGLLLYIGTGIAAMLRGERFLDYSALGAQAQQGQHIGIFLIELGVGVTIVGVVMLIFRLIVNEVQRR